MHAVSDLEDFRANIVPKQTTAEKALIAGDAGPRIEMWSRREPVTLFSAGGEYKSGWEDVSRFFEGLARRFSGGGDFTFEIVSAEVSGDLAYTVGFERFNVSIADGPIGRITIRVTHIYRREEGEWKIIHRHGDSSSDD